MMRRRTLSPAASPALEALESRLMLDGAGPVINELMASNAEGLRDADGDTSDWIEIFNDSDAAVNLAGWYLTDNPDNLTKWAFPSVTIPSYGHLLVFASDKDRADAGQELHTNFKLSAAGEYLALVQTVETIPTIAHELTPAFPPQVPDVSYGLGCPYAETTLVEYGDDVLAYVPTNGDYDETWMNSDNFLPGLEDWGEGTLGVGYDYGSTFGQFIGLNVGGQMMGNATSVYVRITFTVEDAQAIRALHLRMKYDDGFIAYLNATETETDPVIVAQANYQSDGDDPDWQTMASRSHPDSQSRDDKYETFDITPFMGRLVDGENVLAIHGLNYGAASADLIILPELIAWVEPEVPVELPWVNFLEPTPGAMNGQGFLGYVDSPDASVAHGLFEEPIDVVLTSQTPGAVIRYTTDFSEPTETNGTLYTPGAILHLETSTVLRTIAYLPEGSGWSPSATTTYTYIFLDDVLSQSNNQLAGGFPTQWIAGHDHETHYDRQVRDADYAVDPDVALDAGDLLTIPSMSLVIDQHDLWDPYEGIYPNSIQRASTNAMWEKAASLELIHPYGEDDGFTINAGARINGELSRWAAVNNKQSFRLVFQGSYGSTKLTTDLLGDGAAGQYDTLVLRAMWGESFLLDETRSELGPAFLGGDPTSAQYLRDLYGHESYAATGNLAPHGQFVHLYLNGLYWGLYQVTERPDDSFNAAYQGGSPDDYDVIKGAIGSDATNGQLQDGERQLWDKLFSFFDTNPDGTNLYEVETPISDAVLAEVAQYLDLEAFADYMITLWVNARYDFPRKNWYAACERGEPDQPPATPFRFYTWDSEASLGSSSAEGPLERWNGTDADNDTGPVRLYRRLRHNDTFRRLWMDRVQALLLNGGPLSTEANLERYENLADRIDKAIAAESARWGDSSTEYVSDPLTYGQEWIAERDRVLDEFLAQRNGIVLAQMLSVGMWTDVLAPVFNQNGGPFAAGFELTMTDPADNGGTIRYTLDGTDPRDGEPLTYTGPISLSGAAVVRAAIQNGADWSALQEAVFQPLQAAPLAITEINYNPPSLATDGGWNNDDFEFVELYNNGTETINLAGYAFVDGIEFDFAASPVTTLDPGGYVLIVSNPAAFASRYDTTDLVIAGQYTGSLSNGGERITLNAGGRLYCSFAYDDSAAWPGRADGKGATLEAIPGGDVEDDDAWRSSGEFLGTPGAAGAGPLGDVVVSEVLSRTTSPKIDRIELHNTTDDDIDISGWFLSDTWTHYRKFRIPNGTVIRAGDYVSFDERDFNPRGLTPDPADDTPEDFQLDGTTGDDVWVMAADPLTGQLLRFVDHVEFGAGLDQLPLGRWPDADGRLVPMTEATFDGANSGPLVGPVVVSEVMYHAENTDLEFIELHNAGTDEVDISGWRLNGAVDFTFDAGTVLDAGECLVVLPFDPTAPANAARLAAFQTEYGLTDPIAMVGGWTGHLDNSGERIELLYRRPGGPEHVWAFVLAEEATFDDGPDWPAEAAGEGSSLVRIDEEVWGSYPTNWEALEPSPGVGREAGPLPGDADLDGDVDLDDFVILKQNFGTLAGATWEMADFTGEGAVDLDDFVILKQNFGTVATAVSAVDVLAELRVADAGEPASVPPARPVERAAVRRLRRRAPGRGAPQAPATMNVLDLMRLGRPLG